MRYPKEEPVKILYLLVLIFIVYNFLIQPLGFLKVPALSVNDLFFNLSRAGKAVPSRISDIVVVAVDNSSLKEVGQKWPWSRQKFAELISKISAGGPKVIYLDFSFLGKSQDEESDLKLAEAIKKAGNVVLAGYINEDGEYVQPLDIFVSSARAVGLANYRPDAKDSKVRNMRAVFFAKGENASQGSSFDYAVAIKIMVLAKGVPLSSLRYEGEKIVFSPGLEVAVAKAGTLPINYLARDADFQSVSAGKIFDTFLDPSLFQDKIVLIGATANIMHDIHPTPLGKMPGIYIIADSLLMLLTGSFIHELPYIYEMTIFLLFSLAIGLLSLRFKAAYSALALSGILFLSSLAYVFLEAGYNFRMDIFSLILLSLASYLAVEAYKYISLIVESEQLKEMAIRDSALDIYTQRYFQLSAQAALKNSSGGRSNFFCLMRIGEFARLNEKYPQASFDLIKAAVDMIKEYLGKKIMLARYGESEFSMCLWNVKRDALEKSLLLLIESVSSREFNLGSEAVRFSLKIAAVDFPRRNIDSYSDLALTCENVLRRNENNKDMSLAVFKPELDKIVRSTVLREHLEAIPKGELDYVSMDLAARNKELEKALEEIKEQQKKIERLYFQTMHSLVRALEEKDPYTAGHSERVGFYSTELAKGLNLSREEIDAINKAAYLHDIGKIGMPDSVLHKKDKLTEEDFAYIKRHQTDGAKILEGLSFGEKIIPYILHHHERYDGKGYPHGLSGDMIPQGAQIIAIADSFDAMTTGRGYNSPLMLNQAIEELKKSRGIQLNPAYTQRFIELLEEKKINALR